ncbi:MAG: ATPase P [Nitrospirae bacterium]|nr:ATPase P [Nitrospirota bacterium]
MIRVDIQGFGIIELHHFVTDFSGTLAVDGSLLSGIKERLNELSNHLTVHVITSDTFGKAREELQGITCRIQVIEGEHHTRQKENYVKSLGADVVAALGNGNNDTAMLKTARLGISVGMKEGCSVEALIASRVHVSSPFDAIDLLMHPKRLAATLRR